MGNVSPHNLESKSSPMWIFFLSFSLESLSYDITKIRSVSFYDGPGATCRTGPREYMLLFIPSRDCVYSTLLALCSLMDIHKLHVLLLPVPNLQYSYLSTFSSIIVYRSFLVLQIDKYVTNPGVATRCKGKSSL